MLKQAYLKALYWRSLHFPAQKQKICFDQSTVFKGEKTEDHSFHNRQKKIKLFPHVLSVSIKSMNL